jgi:putative spermidine/putrescine transport system substrate-binding protein
MEIPLPQMWIVHNIRKYDHKNLLPVFVHKYPDGKVDGIGAVSWYITLVSNTKVFPEAPKY